MTASLLLDKSELCKLLRVGVETIERLEQEGRIPAPVKLGPRTKRWRRDEISAWIEAGCPEVTANRGDT